MYSTSGGRAVGRNEGNFEGNTKLTKPIPAAPDIFRFDFDPMMMPTGFSVTGRSVSELGQGR
jgi:hypothetical protein